MAHIVTYMGTCGDQIILHYITLFNLIYLIHLYLICFFFFFKFILRYHTLISHSKIENKKFQVKVLFLSLFFFNNPSFEHCLTNYESRQRPFLNSFAIQIQNTTYIYYIPYIHIHWEYALSKMNYFKVGEMIIRNKINCFLLVLTWVRYDMMLIHLCTLRNKIKVDHKNNK